MILTVLTSDDNDDIESSYLYCSVEGEDSAGKKLGRSNRGIRRRKSVIRHGCPQV